MQSLLKYAAVAAAAAVVAAPLALNLGHRGWLALTSCFRRLSSNKVRRVVFIAGSSF